jgi:uncharacterized protein YjbI with pentapeptide repeats
MRGALVIVLKDKQTGRVIGRIRGRSLAGLDLRKASLEGKDLRGVDFSFCDLRGVSLIGCDLRGAKFHKANLEGAAVYGHQIDDETLQRLHEPATRPSWRVQRKSRPEPRILLPARPRL